MGFRPLIWGYLWNFMEKRIINAYRINGFRPLIWGYLWNSLQGYTDGKLFSFPSPNLGLSLKLDL